VVLMVHRPDFTASRSAEQDWGEAEASSNFSETEIIIAKQRNGPTGMVKLTFLKDILRFEGYREPEPQPYVRDGGAPF